jgi:hypothetical protein
MLVLTSGMMIIPNAIGQTKNATNQSPQAPTTNTSSGTNSTANSSSMITLKPSYDFTFKLLKEPPIISKEEQQQGQKILESIDPINIPINQTKHPLLGPGTPGPKMGPQSTIVNESIGNNEQPIKKISFQLVGDRDFHLERRSVSLPAGATNPLEVWPVTEPAVATGPQFSDGRQIVFYVGNAFAARSENGGRDGTWAYYDYSRPPLSTAFRNAGDNDVIYSTAAGGKFIWYRQGEDGRYSIGISSDAQTWTFYERYAKSFDLILSALTPAQRNTLQSQGSSHFPLNPWFDRPQLELTNRHLFINTRVILGCNNGQSPNDPNICNNLNVSGGQCGSSCNEVIGSIILRLNLDQIGQVIPGSTRPTIPAFGFFDRPIFGLVQGATDTMYWGAIPGNDRMKIYSWDDRAFNIQIRDRDIRPFSVDPPDCSHNNIPNTNWCAEYSGNLYGWIQNGEVGFLWDASQGCIPHTSPQCYQNHHCTPRSGEECAVWPYVDAATFNIGDDFRYNSRPSIYNGDYAVRYAYPSPNVHGLAIMSWIGGGNIYPTLVASVDDNYERYYNLHVLISGAGTGGQSRWGDYLRVRPYAGAADLGVWVGSGYAYSTPNSKDVMYFIFGREIYTRTIQNLDLLLPPSTMKSRIGFATYP